MPIRKTGGKRRKSSRTIARSVRRTSKSARSRRGATRPSTTLTAAGSRRGRR